MNKVLFLLASMTFLFLTSCEKDNEQSTIKADIDIIKLDCYPDDSISMTFSITSKGGKAPYNYTWVTPDTFSGGGPFTINIKSDTMFDVFVADENNYKTEFQFEIKKDTIDSTRYDYRNPFTGSYKCIVKYNSTSQDSSGNWQTNTSIYSDTVEVTKHADFRKFRVPGIPALNFNFKDSTLNGIQSNGSFKNDSINLYYFITPDALYNYTYKGIKMN